MIIPYYNPYDMLRIDGHHPCFSTVRQQALAVLDKAITDIAQIALSYEKIFLMIVNPVTHKRKHMTYTPAALKLAEDFVTVAALAGVNLSLPDIEIHESDTHVKPTSLAKGKQAVYVFMQGNKCLKVGKAGPNGTARFCNHHYGLKAPSTLAKSLIKHQSRIGVAGIDEGNVSTWIIENTYRINFLIPSTYGIHALSLLEAFIQCRLQPEFEGFDSQRLSV